MTRSVHFVERMRWMPALVGAAVLALAVGVGFALASGQLRVAAPGSSTVSAQATAGSADPLDPRIAALAARHPGQSIQAIVQFNERVSAARAAIDANAHGRIIGNLPIIHGLAVQVTAAQARALAANPDVHAVSLNTTVTPQSITPGLGIPTMPGSQPAASNQLQTTYDQTLDVTPLWKFGVTGRGVGVAVIDTGIDGALPDFASANGNHSRVIVSAVDNAKATTAGDGYGHGTDVAGIIAGNGDSRPASDPLHGRYVGVAPNANLISIKVADESGTATTLDAIYGLQFAVDHQADYNIRVVNLSFRSTSAGSYTTDPVDAAVEQAWFHGITVVAAAGNLGTASDAVSYAPGNDPYVITVGAVDNQGTRSTWDDVQASWSSRGQTQDGFMKPDVEAPGAHIVTTLSPGSSFASACSTCVIGGAYFQLSGTSLAAPMVSGVAADLLAAHPSWTPAMVKGAIVNTAQPLSDGGDEVRAMNAYWAYGSELSSDQGLTPNNLIDPTTNSIDYNAASWSAASWSTATDPLAASWSAASWSCLSCSSGGQGDVSPTAASWSNVGWATTLG